MRLSRARRFLGRCFLGGLTCLSVIRSTSKHSVNSLSVGTETEYDSWVIWPLPLVIKTFWFLRATATGGWREERKGRQSQKI